MAQPVPDPTPAAAAGSRPVVLVLVGLVLGGLSLGAGILIGRAFPGAGDRHVWSDAAGAPPPASHEVPAAGRAPLLGAPASFADVIEQVGPGVVSVQAMVPIGEVADDLVADGGERRSHGVRSGSGFVVHRDGLIVTARHVTLRASRIVVDLPRLGPYDAELVGEDHVTDLAVLRLLNPPAQLPVLPLGRSQDLRAGDWIVAVGTPFGFTQTVTAGVVSFVGRHLQRDDVRVSSDFLQFSAPVNPGNSGGPVFDLDGRVVGVTTQAADAAQGISFAIPSRTLKWVLDAMDRSADGRVHRGHLGIAFDSRRGIDDYGAPLEGAKVHRVVEGEAASAAGVQPGDVVLWFGDQKVTGSADLYDRITRTAPGTPVRLVLLRNDRVLEPIEVVLGDHSLDPDSDLVH